MTVLDRLATQEPRVASEVETLSRSLSERLRRPPREGFLEEQGLPGEAVRAVLADNTPPSGIFGVGATTIDRSHIAPAIFVLPELAGKPMEPVPIWDTYAASLVTRYTGRMPKDLLAVSLPIPTQANGVVTVGGELSCQGIRGTCGVEVVTASGKRSVLTAGHVAKTVGASVTAAGNTIGTVTLTDYLALHPPSDIVADVAVVKVESHIAIATRRTITGPGTGKQFDGVVADVQQGTLDGWIRSVVPSFALNPNVGCWGEILITDRAISESGDSGAPVYPDENSGTVIGHIVAGAGHAYTLVQDINFVLNRAGATLA